MPNTINSNIKDQYIHYFEPKSNYLHLYPIGNNTPQYPLKISLDSIVPKNSRSVITDRGHIYLTGGVEDTHPENVHRAQGIYYYFL